MTIKRIYAHGAGRLLFDFKLDLDDNYYADWAVNCHLNQHKLCEPEVVRLMVRALRPGDFAIDGGANIGYFSLLMAQLVGPTGYVLAFEPAPDNYAKLRANLALNNAEHVEHGNVALWDTPKQTKRLYLSDQDPGQHSLGAPAQETNPKYTSVVTDTIGCHGGHPRLIKLDVEGAEEFALRGIDFLEQDPPYIITELNEGALAKLNSSEESLRAFMLKCGYDCWLLHEDGNLPTFVPPRTRIKATRMATNILFSRAPYISELYPTVQI